MEEYSELDSFDQWSETYDRDVANSDGAFPFDGYENVLEAVLKQADLAYGMDVLELGAGTGNLTARLVARGCNVSSLDFSPRMLAIAREKAPEANFLQADLSGEWPDEIENLEYDRIVSTYVFHEFEFPVKIRLLEHAICLLKEDGLVVVGDISFPNIRSREEMRARSPDTWDEEDYWLGEDLPALRAAGLQVEYKQISSCGGVWVIQPGGER